MLFNLFWMAFGFGFIARSVRMLQQSSGLVYGVPASLRAMSILPWIMAAVAGALLWSTGAAFARRWWDWPRRALFVLATLGALLTVCFLVRWNYLPATF